MNAMTSTTPRPHVLANGFEFYSQDDGTWHTTNYRTIALNNMRHSDFIRHQFDYPDGSGIASALVMLAEDIQRNLDHEVALRDPRQIPDEPLPSGDIRITEEPTEEVKIERAARESNATPEQLARLRALVTAERESIRQARELEELRAEVNRLRNEEITKYDPRIEPMLRDLAELANERSFCSEFDLVLDHIGSPLSREELYPQQRSGHVHVMVSFNVSVDVDDIDDYDIDADDVIEAVRSYGMPDLIREATIETGDVCPD